MFCSKCGSPNQDNHVRCIKCGNLLRGQSDMGESAAMRMLLPVGRSGLAIAAGYAGLFALLVAPAPIALVLGIMAMFDLKRNPKKHGWGRAIFGTVVGLAGTGLLIFVLISIAAE
jgi:hypothetical protein